MAYNPIPFYNIKLKAIFCVRYRFSAFYAKNLLQYIQEVRRVTISKTNLLRMTAGLTGHQLTPLGKLNS